MVQVHTVKLQKQEHKEIYTAHIERNGDGWIGLDTGAT